MDLVRLSRLPPHPRGQVTAAAAIFTLALVCAALALLLLVATGVLWWAPLYGISSWVGGVAWAELLNQRAARS